MCSATNVPSVVSTQKRPAGAPGGPFCVIAWLSVAACHASLLCQCRYNRNLAPSAVLWPKPVDERVACRRSCTWVSMATRSAPRSRTSSARTRPPCPLHRRALSSRGTTADRTSGLSFSAFDRRSCALSPWEACSDIMNRFMGFACGRYAAGLSLAGWRNSPLHFAGASMNRPNGADSSNFKGSI